MKAEKINTLLVTETWLSDRDSDKIWLQATNLNKKDLNLFSSNRKERREGGLGLIIKNIYNTTTIAQGELQCMHFPIHQMKDKCMHFPIHQMKEIDRSHYLNHVGVYRPPSVSILDFLGEF